MPHKTLLDSSLFPAFVELKRSDLSGGRRCVCLFCLFVFITFVSVASCPSCNDPSSSTIRRVIQHVRRYLACTQPEVTAASRSDMEAPPELHSAAVCKESVRGGSRNDHIITVSVQSLPSFDPFPPVSMVVMVLTSWRSPLFN